MEKVTELESKVQGLQYENEDLEETLHNMVTITPVSAARVVQDITDLYFTNSPLDSNLNHHSATAVWTPQSEEEGEGQAGDNQNT